jgi:hypothetical protein
MELMVRSCDKTIIFNIPYVLNVSFNEVIER